VKVAAVGRGPGDSALWSRAAQGDHDAFGQLFDRHSGAVYSYLFRLTANWSEARRGVLELFYNCDPGTACRVAFDVAVPRAVNVIVHSAVGQIRLAGLTGTVTAYTGTGQIQATGLSVRSAELGTGTGLISAGFTVPPRRIVASTGVGSVTIRVPATGRYQVAASAQLGPVTVTVPRLPRAGHVIQARTGTGTITITDS